MGREEDFRREIKPADDFGPSTRASKPEERVDCDPGVRSLGMCEKSGRRAVSPVMRGHARSMDAPVSRVQLDAPKKALAVAAPVMLLSSAGRVVAAAVSVPISVEGVMAVEGDDTQTQRRGVSLPVSYTHLTLPTIYSV